MANDFKPTVGKKIPKKDAMAWIEKYDKEMRKDKNTDTKSIFYGRDALLRILSIEGSAGITFFPALKYSETAKKDIVTLVLVPTKEDGTLIWSSEPAATEKSTDAASLSLKQDDAYDDGATCPPYCPR